MVTSWQLDQVETGGKQLSRTITSDFVDSHCRICQDQHNG